MDSQDSENDILQSISDARSQLMMMDSTVPTIAEVAQSGHYMLPKLSPRSSTQVIDEIRNLIVPDRERQLAYIKQLENEVESEHAAFLAMQEDNATLRNQVNQISKMNLTAEQKLQHTEQLEEQLDLLRDFKENISEKSKQAQVELQSAHFTAEEQQRTIQELEEQVNKANERTALTNSRNIELEQSIADLQEQLENRLVKDKEKCERLERLLEEEREQLEVKVETLEMENTDLRAKSQRSSDLEAIIEQLQTQLGRQEAANENYDRNLAVLSDQLAQERDERESMNQRFEEAMERAQSSDSDCAMLQEQLASSKEAFEALEDRVADLTDEFDRQKSEYEALCEERSEMEQKHKETTEAASSAEATADAVTQQKNTLSAENQQLRSQLSRLLDQAETLERRMDAGKTEAEEVLKTERADWEREKTQLRAQLSNTEQSLESAEETAEHFENECAALKSSVNELKSQLEAAERGISESNRETGDLQDKIERITGENDAMKAEIRELNGRLSQCKNDAETLQQKSARAEEMKELIEQENNKLREVAAANAQLLAENKHLAQMLRDAEETAETSARAENAEQADLQAVALESAAHTRQLFHVLRMLKMDVSASNEADSAACTAVSTSACANGQNSENDENSQQPLDKIPLLDSLAEQRRAVDEFSTVASNLLKEAREESAAVQRERQLCAQLQERQIRVQKENSQLAEQIAFYEQAKDSGQRQHRQLVAQLQTQIEQLKQRIGGSAANLQGSESRGAQLPGDPAIDILTSQIAQLQLKNDALEKQNAEALVPALNTRILELETSQKQADREKMTYAQQLELTRQQLGLKQEENAHFKGKIIQMQRRIDQLEAEGRQLDPISAERAAEQDGQVLLSQQAIREENEQMRKAIGTYQQRLAGDADMEAAAQRPVPSTYPAIRPQK